MDQTDLDAVDATVADLRVWLEQAQAALVPRSGRIRIEWQRHGLVSVHERLEQLKDDSAHLGAWQEAAARCLGSARGVAVLVQGFHDDMVGVSLEPQVSTMAARGMAADERRIAHDTRALPWTIRRRRIEALLPSLDAIERAFRQRLYEARDERQDLRAQLRAIDLGVEIGEL